MSCDSHEGSKIRVRPNISGERDLPNRSLSNYLWWSYWDCKYVSLAFISCSNLSRCPENICRMWRRIVDLAGMSDCLSSCLRMKRILWNLGDSTMLMGWFNQTSFTAQSLWLTMSSPTKNSINASMNPCLEYVGRSSSPVSRPGSFSVIWLSANSEVIGIFCRAQSFTQSSKCWLYRCFLKLDTPVVGLNCLTT